MQGDRRLDLAHAFGEGFLDDVKHRDDCQRQEERQDLASANLLFLTEDVASHRFITPVPPVMHQTLVDKSVG